MRSELYFTKAAQATLDDLEKSPDKEKVLKQIKKTLGLMEVNLRHPSLNTHAYHSLSNPINPKEKVFEAYAQQNTPAAYRVFWVYGPGRGKITIVAVTPHP
jgi:hypothetical protein